MDKLALVESLLPLDNSIACFERIKALSEKVWKDKAYVDGCWGGQIQKNSKWKKGLSNEEIDDFEQQIGVPFPDSLRNFYATMNGLDRKGLDFLGDLNNEPELRTQFYSYPLDFDTINERIDWIFEENRISREEVAEGKAPFVFPYYIHRFLVFDDNEHALSMYGSDIIYWADNLAKGLAKDIFKLYDQQIEMNYYDVQFWLRDFE